MNDALDVRAALLTAATRRFAQGGYAGTSLQVVADDVGVRKASLLYWFPSKADLREAVIDAQLDRWKDTLPAALAAATTGRDRFARILQVALEFFDEDPDRARLLLRECLDRPDAMRARLLTRVAPWMGLVTEAIRQGQREGRVRPDLDPEAWLVQVVVLVLGSAALGDVADRTVLHHSAAQHQDAADRRLRELVRVARSSLYLDDAPEG
ncbi:MAG: TetR family transcriptional regulator [Alphaproteobacteria bacterium]|nr:TetR family transcriptional regulator [Alphaproteobacteria bacterium]